MNSPRLLIRDVPPDSAHALQRAGFSPLLSRLFAARGVLSHDELDPDLKHLLPPEGPQGLLGIDRAAVLLAEAIAAGDRICIVADYDCDGATACAVMLRGLSLLGARPGTVSYVVPDRAVHGYGLTPTIVELALRHEPKLLVTVDNGIASHAGVAFARELGLKVLVTDHHLPAVTADGQPTVPDADALVNPNQPGCPFPRRRPARRRRDRRRPAPPRRDRRPLRERAR